MIFKPSLYLRMCSCSNYKSFLSPGDCQTAQQQHRKGIILTRAFLKKTTKLCRFSPHFSHRVKRQPEKLLKNL